MGCDGRLTLCNHSPNVYAARVLTLADLTDADDIWDGCAGPGGWSVALRMLGLRDIGFGWDSNACATREAAGHGTIQADVAQVDLTAHAGKVTGLIFSPPCTLFSSAGKKAGRNAIEILTAAMRQVVAGNDVREQARLDAAEAIYENEAALTVHGAAPIVVARRITHALEHAEWSLQRAYNACLVLEPARWAHDLRPEWVALEQVPAVLPLWEELARGLRLLGYSVWTGILNSADFGVPQTRRRAFLMASRVRQIHPPEPTHAKDPTPTLFGTPEKWVSMAEALGWNGGRVGFARRDDRGDSPDGYRVRDWTEVDQPAPL